MIKQALLNMPGRADRAVDFALAKKANTKSRKTPAAVRGGGGITEKISLARVAVEKALGQYREYYAVLRTPDEVAQYLDNAIQDGEITIDTETTGLDPLTDTLVGISMYSPTQKAVYIPLNHKSYITERKSDNQVLAKDIKPMFDKLFNSEIVVIMFNAVFDIRVLRAGLKVSPRCDWDCYLAARLLNENEGVADTGLKALHKKYCDPESSGASFTDLFKGISFDLVPIDIGYPYAAHDAKMTYELYKFQKPFLTAEDPVCVERDLQGVAYVFYHIEMPCVQAVADMEDTGVAFDLDLAKQLHTEYTKKKEEAAELAYSILDTQRDVVEKYKKQTPDHKLSDPINLDSFSQIATVLYDILELPVVDKKNPRGTGEDILKQLDSDFTRALLEYRGIAKLISTYIDKLPICVNKQDGRIHCKFNQYGADTGRFSSSDPNLQNIPSHNKDIRKMFVATTGYVMMSADYSQQEPKCLAALCKEQGDPQMYNTFLQGKDLYSEIASKAFNVPYEQCHAHKPDGTTDKKGKERRDSAKTILLGTLYGRGTESIAEQLGVSTRKAQEVREAVFVGFPAIKKFEEDSIRMAETLGFVTTVCGRKRRLPSMTLPDFEVKWKDGVPKDADPLSFDNDTEVDTEVPQHIATQWISKVMRTPFWQRRDIYEVANANGLWIVDNTKDKDVTKVVNARIQGSAADLTKAAIIELHKDEKLKELGFRMLIPVHDEVIAECPRENAKECSERLAEIMSIAAEKIIHMPISCEVEVTDRWFGEQIKV